MPKHNPGDLRESLGGTRPPWRLPAHQRDRWAGARDRELVPPYPFRSPYRSRSALPI